MAPARMAVVVVIVAAPRHVRLLEAEGAEPVPPVMMHVLHVVIGAKGVEELARTAHGGIPIYRKVAITIYRKNIECKCPATPGKPHAYRLSPA